VLGKEEPCDLGEFNTLRTIATVGGIAGHGGVATGGTEEPFSVGSGLHELEITILDAVGAANGAAAIALDSFHFDDKGVTFFVDGKAPVVDGGRLGSERLGADRAAGGFGVHHYRYRFCCLRRTGK
jgi:hypothetical protein